MVGSAWNFKRELINRTGDLVVSSEFPRIRETLLCFITVLLYTPYFDERFSMIQKAAARILMCKPSYFAINYEINPWMRKTIPVDQNESHKQWKNLEHTLQSIGAQIELVDPQPDWPDLVFTANAGMLMGTGKVYLSHFKYAERQGERQYFEKWFKQNGFEVFGDTDKNFEGAGDALMAGDKLFAAYGFRTDISIYDKILAVWNFDASKLIRCKLVDPRFYHIDTCFCPLSTNLAMWFPNAFAADSQSVMTKNIELIPVPEKEAVHFACNSVVVDNQVVMPGDCSETAKLLERNGFKVHQCEMNEFLKAGGACKCLTLRLN